MTQKLTQEQLELFGRLRMRHLKFLFTAGSEKIVDHFFESPSNIFVFTQYRVYKCDSTLIEGNIFIGGGSPYCTVIKDVYSAINSQKEISRMEFDKKKMLVILKDYTIMVFDAECPTSADNCLVV